MHKIERPTDLDPNVYFTNYLNKAKGNDLIQELENSAQEIIDLLKQVSTEKETYRYAEGKWTIKQLIQHIVDAERIFAYRALRISRKDTTSLPGYDEDLLAANDFTSELTLKQIIDDFVNVRRATITLFKNMNPEALDFAGEGNGFKLTPRYIGWIVIGHLTHHIDVLHERYL